MTKEKLGQDKMFITNDLNIFSFFLFPLCYTNDALQEKLCNDLFLAEQP